MTEKEALRAAKTLHQRGQISKSEAKALRKWLRAKAPKSLTRSDPAFFPMELVCLLVSPTPSLMVH